MTTPLSPPTLKSACKMRRIIARSVSLRVSTNDCILASHKYRKPKLVSDQKSWAAMFKAPPPTARGFPSLTMTKQRSCLVRDAIRMYKQDRNVEDMIMSQPRLQYRFSTKLPRREMSETGRFCSLERELPVSSQESKMSLKLPGSPIRSSIETPSFVLLRRNRPDKDSDLESQTSGTRCSEGSETKITLHEHKEEKKLRSYIPERARWFVKTRRGQKFMSGATTNQDSYFAREDFGGFRGLNFLGVCDGHGPAGHLVSKHVSFSLSNFFSTLLKDYLGESRFMKTQNSHMSLGSQDQRLKLLIEDEDSTDMDQLLKMAFVQTHRALSREDFDIQKSGTSACTVLVAHSTLFCANSGDSRAVLGRKDGMFWKPVALSRDHKPTEDDEKRRIIANNGRVLRISGGSPRIWLQDKLEPGLALSRSLGDRMAHKVGVISTPEIKRHELSINEKFIIIGSDGLWDKVPSTEAVNLVGDYWKAGHESLAVGALVALAAQRWKEDGKGDDYYMDDMTALVIFFQ